MSPTIFKTGKYRFFFFSREEKRIHVHVTSPDGEAKFWIEPTVSLLKSDGLTKRQINAIQKIIEANKDEIVKKWKKHFGA
jgi:hypothetical protein